MNVYDFDHTIYNGDCTLDFYLFCVFRHPVILICIPRQLLAIILERIGKIDRTEMKSRFFCYFRKLHNIDEDVGRFWDLHEVNIKAWYKQQQLPDDVVISASPHFLLAEICKRCKIDNLIASHVNKNTGRFEGKNCCGEEKIRRYLIAFPECSIDCFYSDSYSDEPIAMMSKKAFFVTGSRIEPWNYNRAKKRR